MTVGLGIKLKSMSVRSWRWTSLRLPQNPHIAARVLRKRANLSFVFMYIMTDAYGSLHFSAIFSDSLLFTLLHSGATLTVVVKTTTRGLNKDFSMSINHSLVVFILLLLFILLVDLCQGLPRIWLWGRMCDPYVKESFLTAIPQSSRRDI